MYSPLPTKPCAAPLWALFAAGCVLVVLSFATVATYSGIQFTTNINSAVDSNVELALRGAMQTISNPLAESARYLGRLKGKVEDNPQLYAIDDDFGATFESASTRGFFIDALPTAYQRGGVVSSVYQVRKSSRYFHGPGNPVDIAAVAAMPSTQAIFLANNFITLATLANMSQLSNLSAVPAMAFPANTSGAPWVVNAYATSKTTWTVGILQADGYPITTRISLCSRIENPTNTPWAVCIDHNMTVFRELMLQATAPFSIGITNVLKTPVSGAHTSLYDLRGKSLMSTSLTGIELYKSGIDLWPAGASPSSSLNADYAIAVAACDKMDCTAEPAIAHGNTFVSAFRLTDAASGLDLLLVSSTPRKFFLGDADKTRNVSIAVAVVCCVVVVAGCIALLLAIRPTLRQLQENMLLASELRNNLVVHTPSRLTELVELSAVFDDMNQRLTIARSFVPEAILLGQDDEEANEEELGESSVLIESKPSSRKQSSVMSTRSSIYSVLRQTQDKTSSLESSMAGEKMSKLFTMAEKRVAILSLNLVGFNRVALNQAGLRPQRINDVTSRLLSIVVAAAQREKGVMDSFHGDHFVLSYNASRVVGNGLMSAVRTASSVCDEVRRDGRFSGCCGVAAGAASGKAQVGTLGIDGHRRFSIVGPVYRNAIALQAVCAQFLQKTAGRGGRKIPQSGCIVDEAAVKEIGECGLYMQLVGVGVSPISGAHRRLLAAHVTATKAGGGAEDDEWLY